MTNVILLNLGYFLVFLALAIREMLWLRITITGKPASADVVSPERLTYYIWNRNNLDKLRNSKPATMGKLDSILTLDMAGKLTR